MIRSRSAARSRTPLAIAFTKDESVLSKPSRPRACSTGSLPDNCQAYSACRAISRAWRLALFMQLCLELGHLDGAAHRFGALVQARHRLRLILGGQNAVGDWQAEVERHVHQAARG